MAAEPGRQMAIRWCGSPPRQARKARGGLPALGKRRPVYIVQGMALRDRCAADVAFTGKDLDTLLALDDGAHELELRRYCELDDHHDGPHGVLAQTCNDGDWWLLWSWAGRELAPRAICGATQVIRDPNEPDICDLPAGHAGVHDYELGPRTRWDVPTEVQRKHIQRLVHAYRNGLPLDEFDDQPAK